MREFLDISHAIGASPVFIQGAGGNTSMKMGDTMLVKASGAHLRDLGEGRGYVSCRFAPILGYLAGDDGRSADPESALNRLIETHMIARKSFGVPSIETSMHALFPSRFVLHTHHVYANVFTCMRGGKNILGEIFSDTDFLFVSYHQPGFFLAQEILDRTKKLKTIPPIVFLQNHGLIVHHDDPAKALALKRLVTRKIRGYLQEKNVFVPFRVTKNTEPFGKKHLFPDSAVYLGLDPRSLAPEKRKAYAEISSAARYILATIHALGKTPRFLSGQDIAYIRNMEKEKLRLKSFVS